MSARDVLRIGMWLLAASAAALGAWALLGPESFYEDFPGGGKEFISSLPPYNEHLTRDFGSLNLALAVVLALGAVSLQRALVVAGLLAVLVNGVPHFLFHFSEQGTLSDSDQVANLAGLVLPIVVAVALLVLQWVRPRAVK